MLLHVQCTYYVLAGIEERSNSMLSAVLWWRWWPSWWCHYKSMRIKELLFKKNRTDIWKMQQVGRIYESYRLIILPLKLIMFSVFTCRARQSTSCHSQGRASKKWYYRTTWFDFLVVIGDKLARAVWEIGIATCQMCWPTYLQWWLVIKYTIRSIIHLEQWVYQQLYVHTIIILYI